MLTGLVKLLVPACLFLSLVAFSACATAGGGSGANGESAKGSVSSGIDPKGEVTRAFRNQSTRPYRLRETTTMSGPGGTNSFSRVLEVVPPDRFHATMDNYETISIGDDHYEKSDGKWSRGSGLGRKNVSREAGEQFLRQIEAGNLAITYIGRDTVDGKPSRLYQMTGAMKFGTTEIKGEYKIWLSATEDAPIKTHAKSEAPYVMESVLTYEYDPGIKIEAPIP